LLTCAEKERNSDMDNEIKLGDIGNRKPFTIPENYFDDFGARLQSQLELQPQTETVKSNKIIRPWMYMAAMFTGILLMVSVVTSYYNRKLIAKNENYELYVISQLNDDMFYEYYINDNNQKNIKEAENNKKNR
jgi:hypothetical protein